MKKPCSRCGEPPVYRYRIHPSPLLSGPIVQLYCKRCGNTGDPETSDPTALKRWNDKQTP